MRFRGGGVSFWQLSQNRRDATDKPKSALFRRSRAKQNARRAIKHGGRKKWFIRALQLNWYYFFVNVEHRNIAQNCTVCIVVNGGIKCFGVFVVVNEVRRTLWQVWQQFAEVIYYVFIIHIFGVLRAGRFARPAVISNAC